MGHSHFKLERKIIFFIYFLFCHKLKRKTNFNGINVLANSWPKKQKIYKEFFFGDILDF